MKINKKYQIIYADPPWMHTQKNIPEKKFVKNHYNVMSLEEIKNLPIDKISDKNCFLFLWATFPCLPEALEVIKAWGFEYKTIAFNWIKENKKKKSFFWGLGAYTRANSEICLIAKKGTPKVQSHSVHSVVVSKIREHSRKPDEIRNKIIELCGDVPRIELFAREKTEGWDAWGDEIK